MSKDLSECIKSGLLSAVLSLTGSFLMAFYIVPFPDSPLINALNNGISGGFSGLLSGFMGLFMYFKMTEKKRKSSSFQE